MVIDELEKLALLEESEKKENTDFVPEVESPIVEEAPSMMVMALAGIAVNVAEGMMKMAEPYVKLLEDERENAIDIVAVMIMTGGGEVPLWMVPYLPYIQGFIGLGFIGSEVMKRARADKEAAMIEAEKAKVEAA